ncbi:hypothetical protein [Aeromonas sobria]|uniref:hypothetical protein n=1 Tax=Aeromonas sobria TaxID=646 RepID=UPI00111A62F5|nr:hypothetical protein [Aeromonas sobria]TNI80231.1 hypothetical protein CF119_18915 [Aeromonas sobria]
MKKILITIAIIAIGVFLYKKHKETEVSERIATSTIKNALYFFHKDIKEESITSIDITSYKIERIGNTLWVDASGDVSYSINDNKQCKKIKVHSSGKFGNVPDESDIVGDCN